MDKIGTVTYENRVFMHNLSYDCDEEDIKNWLKAMKDVEPLSVSMLTNPRVNKPSGAAYWLCFCGVFVEFSEMVIF